MTRFIINIIAVACLFAIVSCQEKTDFSGTYHWAQTLSIKQDNKYLPEKKTSFLGRTAKQMQTVKGIMPNTLTIRKDNEGNFFGSADILIYKSFDQPRGTFDLENVNAKADSLFFSINMQGTTNRFCMVSSEQPVLLYYPKSSKFSVGNNPTAIKLDDNVIQYTLFDKLNEIQKMHDELILAQLDENSDDTNDPENPQTKFYSQFLSQHLEIY